MVPGQSLFLESLPTEILFGILGATPGHELLNVAAVSRGLQSVTRSVAQQRRVQLGAQLRAPGGPCFAYPNCLNGVLGAIAADDAQQLRRLLASGVVDPRQPVILAPVEGQSAQRLIIWRSAYTHTRDSDLGGVHPPTIGLYADLERYIQMPGSIESERPVSGWRFLSLINLAASMVAPSCLAVLIALGARPLPDNAASAIDDAIGTALPTQIEWYEYVRSEGSSVYNATMRRQHVRAVAGPTVDLSTGQTSGPTSTDFVDTIRLLVKAFADRAVMSRESPLDVLYRVTLRTIRDLGPAFDKESILAAAGGAALVLADAGYSFGGIQPAEPIVLQGSGGRGGVSTVRVGAALEGNAIRRQVNEVFNDALINREPPSERQQSETAAAQMAIDTENRVTALFGAVPSRASVPNAALTDQLVQMIQSGGLDPIAPMASVFGIRSVVTVPWMTLQWGLTSPFAPTILAYALFYNDRAVIEAAIGASVGTAVTPIGRRASAPIPASPWPTPENVTNTALYALRRAPVVPEGATLDDAMAAAAINMSRSVETRVAAASLLERSPALAPLDVNPLTVARNGLWVNYANQLDILRSFGVPFDSDVAQVHLDMVGQLLAAAAVLLVQRLVANGYDPSERMAAIPHPAVNSGLAQLVNNEQPDRESMFPANVPTAVYDAMVQATELDGLQSDIDMYRQMDPSTPLAGGVRAILQSIVGVYNASPALLAGGRLAMP